MVDQIKPSGIKPPAGLKWRSHTLFIVSTVGVGAFTDLFLYGLIVPVLPFMLKERINVPDSQVQSTIDNLLAVYAGASCAASPIAGILSDQFASSRQVPFVLGLSLLLCATVLLAVGQTLAVLSIARFLQGASGGIVWTIGLSIIIETVGQHNLGKTMGTVFSFISVAGFFSPILGGLLYVKTGYKGVFGVGVAVVAIDLILRLLMIEKKTAAQYLGDLSPSSEDNEPTETSPLLPTLHPKSSPYRLQPPTNRLTRALPIMLLLRSPTLLTAIWISLMQALLLGAFDATVPLQASTAYAFDSLKAGLLFLPLGGADFLLGPVFGWCVDRYGTRWFSVLAFGVLVPTLVALRIPEIVAVKDHLALGQQIALYAGLLAANGVGLAMVSPISIVEAGNIVEKYYGANKDVFVQAPYAQLYGLTSMMFSAGLTLGPLVAGGLRERIGYGDMNAVLAGICGGTAVLCAVFVGRQEGDTKEVGEEESDN